MAGSNVFMNWGTVTVTPTAPTASAIVITEVLDIEIDGRSVQKAFYGDNKQFPAQLRNTQKTRSIKIVGGNITKLLSIPEDSECTITAQLLDAINGATAAGGGILITAVRAKSEGRPFKATNNEYATGDLMFNCSGGTNDADPITITAL